MISHMLGRETPLANRQCAHQCFTSERIVLKTSLEDRNEV